MARVPSSSRGGRLIQSEMEEESGMQRTACMISTRAILPMGGEC